MILAYKPGYLHVDVKYLPQMADETARRYLFVAIDRATRWVLVRVYRNKTAANARRFLRDLGRACPIRIRTILTDNGKEFTDRLFGLRKRAASGAHEFDTLCTELGIEHRASSIEHRASSIEHRASSIEHRASSIEHRASSIEHRASSIEHRASSIEHRASSIEHRLAPPMHPQTNGRVERFNGRIEEVLRGHHFRSGEELEATLHRYVWLYNQQLTQSALASKTPLQAMKDWCKLKPELFKKQLYYLAGCDN